MDRSNRQYSGPRIVARLTALPEPREGMTVRRIYKAPGLSDRARKALDRADRARVRTATIATTKYYLSSQS